MNLTFTIPNSRWLSSNQRLHWASKAKRTADLRAIGAMKAHLDGTRHTEPVHITAHIGYPTAGRADPANAYPTIKALIDGMVQAGLLVDDSHEWVAGPDMRRDPVKCERGHHTVRLEIVARPGGE